MTAHAQRCEALLPSGIHSLPPVARCRLCNILACRQFSYRPSCETCPDRAHQQFPISHDQHDVQDNYLIKYNERQGKVVVDKQATHSRKVGGSLAAGNTKNTARRTALSVRNRG